MNGEISYGDFFAILAVGIFSILGLGIVICGSLLGKMSKDMGDVECETKKGS